MRRAISETNRRRSVQMAYNRENGITPESIRKAVRDLLEITRKVSEDEAVLGMSAEELQMAIAHIEDEMLQAAANLDFERAAELRNQMFALKGNPAPNAKPQKKTGVMKRRKRR
jgi:excinuclease ABC subunit B